MDKVIEHFTNKSINYFVNHEYIDKNKKTAYQYGALVAIQSIINITSTLIVGLLFNLFVENLFFFVVFKSLRKYSGGFHFEKFSICFIASVLLNIIFLFSFKLFMLYPNFFLLIFIELISITLIVILSPVTNKNKSISKKEFKLYKLIVYIICFVVFLCSLYLIKQRNYYVFSFVMATLLDSILLVFVKLRNEDVKKSAVGKHPK